jgi:tRNA-splicing endonuclease subunit Sen54
MDSTRTTRLPSLHELTNLFGQLPDVIPQASRRKRENRIQEKKNDSSPSSMPPATLWFGWLQRFIGKWLFPMKWILGVVASPRQNPFALLKTGKKIIVIAAVDSGNISFFRFGQGGFDEWPML